MAKKQRFRAIKKQRVQREAGEDTLAIPFAPLGVRAKAFLTDVFMLLMPMLYLSIYLIHDGLKDVAMHRLEAWAYALIPFLIFLTLFMVKDEGRTPGARAQGLKVVALPSLEKPSLFAILFRNATLLFSLFIPLFWLMPFVRKDRAMLHDYLSATALIIDPNPPKQRVLK
jgi:uncharacterized RDD family membrane protein YckC